MKAYYMKLVAVMVSVWFISNVSAQPYQPDWSSLDKRPIPQWFTGAKFGIFIHWGVYSVPAWGPANIDVGHRFGLRFSEWYWYRLHAGDEHFVKHHQGKYGNHYSYQQFAQHFTAENFDPDHWATLFERSGAKYVVLTSKHHEGFTLWPSKQSWNWNAADIGPNRDLLGDLTKSVREKGLRMGYYYSLLEWFNPLYNDDPSAYVDRIMIPQLKDLVESYKPDIVWGDGEWTHDAKVWKSQEFLAWLYNESSVKDHVVVNDRWGKGTRSHHGGFYTTEYGKVLGDEEIGEKAFHPWEECRGIGTSFGYNQMEDLRNYQSSEELIRLLIEKVGNGGNLLLNIGPTADGRIPVIMQQRLSDIGDWLRVNGEAIYETSGGQGIQNVNEDPVLFFTKKGRDVYVLCTQWPTKPISVGSIDRPSKITLLGSDIRVKSAFKNNTLTIMPPVTINPGNSPCKYAWVFKLENVLL